MFGRSRSTPSRFIQIILNHSLTITSLMNPLSFVRMITSLGNCSFFGTVFQRNTMYRASFLPSAVQYSITVNRVLMVCRQPADILCSFRRDCRAVGHVEVDRCLVGVPDPSEKLILLILQLENIALKLHQSSLVFCWQKLTDGCCITKGESIVPHELFDLAPTRF